MRLTLRQFCNIVYGILTEGADPEELDEFDAELLEPID